MMKKYSICFLLFVSTSAACFMAGYLITRNYVKRKEVIPNVTQESVTLPEASAVISQKEIEPVVETEEEEQYYLVSEAGFLLVFAKDQSTVCLYTHIPITDFPEQERQKLMGGIWFANMLDIFHYLESFTS